MIARRTPQQLTPGDIVAAIGRGTDARRFDPLAHATLAAFPQLHPWLRTHPLALIEHADTWPRVLAVLEWSVRHPRPCIYLRQLDILGVDSKLIETRKGLLAEFLDHVLPAEAMAADAFGVRQFEMRYGLLSKPPTIRFRLLDPGHYIGGLSDLSVPVAQFASLQSGGHVSCCTGQTSIPTASPFSTACVQTCRMPVRY